MPQENVEMARLGDEAFNRTLAEGGNDYYEFLDEEVEWVPITAFRSDLSRPRRGTQMDGRFEARLGDLRGYV
jgi:hypothetical protein